MDPDAFPNGLRVALCFRLTGGRDSCDHVENPANGDLGTSMYRKHFGLRFLPFETVSNSNVYVDLPNHREALNTILFGLRSGEGFVKIVGEVGTGKTALCRNLLARLPEQFVRVYLPNPDLEPLQLARTVADELGVPLPQNAGMHIIQQYTREVLLEIARSAGRVVICIDEAQAMPIPSLEELRLLSNLESNHGRLVQVVLFGQPEFNQKLACYSLRQLQQRIVFSARLSPLDRKSHRFYVNRRLIQAGSRSRSVITPPALERIFRGSGGIPRLINILCHKSLLAAFADGDYQVGRKHVARALADTEGRCRWQTRPIASPRGRNLLRKRGSMPVAR